MKIFKSLMLSQFFVAVFFAAFGLSVFFAYPVAGVVSVSVSEIEKQIAEQDSPKFVVGTTGSSPTFRENYVAEPDLNRLRVPHDTFKHCEKYDGTVLGTQKDMTTRTFTAPDNLKPEPIRYRWRDAKTGREVYRYSDLTVEILRQAKYFPEKLIMEEALICPKCRKRISKIEHGESGYHCRMKMTKYGNALYVEPLKFKMRVR